MRIHTRINVTPTGLDPRRCSTRGNLGTARVNHRFAQALGGAFIVQFEDLLAVNQSVAYHNDRQPYMDAILAQFAHYGIVPSSPETLAAFGIKPECGVMRGSDYKQVVDFAWDRLPWKEKLGDWPPLWVEGSRARGGGLFFDTSGGLHPYLITERVVLDAISGRTAFANGEDCLTTRDLYAAIALLLEVPVAKQWTVPLLLKTDGHKIAVSDDSPENPYFLTHAMDAGVTQAEMWGYLQATAIRPGCNFMQCDMISLTEPDFLPQPIIEDAHWCKFLKANSKKRSLMIDEL